MIVPPALLHVHLKKPEARPVRLWLPLFLLWPLVLVLGALAFVLTVLVDVALYALGKRYHHYTLLLLRLFALFCATRGTVIDINDGRTTVAMTVL